MPINFHLFDEMITDPKDLTQTPLFIQLCHRDDMNNRALASAVLMWRELKIERSTSIVFMIGGYDNDPRELWQIPEVRRFVHRFCARTKAHAHPAVEPMSRNLLLLCGADPDRRFTRNPISAAEDAKQTMDFIEAKLKE